MNTLPEALSSLPCPVDTACTLIENLLGEPLKVAGVFLADAHAPGNGLGTSNAPINAPKKGENAPKAGHLKGHSKGLSGQHDPINDLFI